MNVQERVAKLQELYLRGLEDSQAPAATAREAIAQRNLLQLATPEVLALSEPPRDFPGPEPPAATAIVPALHQIGDLRRTRDGLTSQVRSSGV